MTSLNPHQDAAAQALAQLDVHLAALSAKSPKHARHARCIRLIATATVQAMAAERDAGADNYEILEALGNALGNAVTSVCSTVAGDPRSPLAAIAAFKLLADINRQTKATLGPEASETTFVSAEARTGHA